MIRSCPIFSAAVWLVSTVAWAQVSVPVEAPVTYELMINGESFTIEANKMVTLRSEKQPDVAYDVALRIAPIQHITVGSVGFDFDWLSRVKIESGGDQPTARLDHELGFSLIVTDLGHAISPEGLVPLLKLVTDSVVETFRERQARQLVIAAPHTPDLDGVEGRGVVIRYVNGEGVKHACLVYVLTGPNFTVSCVVQYLEANFEEVRDLIATTLNSFEPAD